MKEFWDFEETVGYIEVKAKDGIIYKVWESGNTQLAADTLARVRKDLNKLLLFAYNNPQYWYDKPIAWGMFLTFDVHMPNVFNYQEINPIAAKELGLLGINKPKEITTLSNGYRVGTGRSIFLTLRNNKTDRFDNYSKIIDLAIHELTHTTCNDIVWKKDNHEPPYNSYHLLMRKMAKDCGII
jgi:hypothetical protein